jgi:hypothetical protein
VNAKPRATVRKRLVTTSPQKQAKAIRDSTPRFSHDEYLPLSINVKRTGWFCRTLRVRTVEQTWYSDAALEVICPAGMESDLASIPKILFCFVTPWDIALESLFHDRIYREQPNGVARIVADAALLSMMEQRGVPRHIRWPVYAGVRMFGGAAWRKNAALIARRNRVIDLASRGSEG